MFSAKRHMVHDFDDIYKKYKNKERFVGVYNWREPQVLITSFHSDWQLISPALNSNRIRAYYPIIEETSKRLVNFLNKTCKNPPKDGLEAKELAMMYTLDIVGAGIYGIDSGTFSEDHPTELFKMAKNLFNQDLFFFVYMSIVTMFPKISNFFIVSFFSDKVGKFFLNVVKETVKYKTDYTETRANFLGYLMELNKK
uniref:Cytochrome P450 n=1 Tax=Megaselia scalaris TaxID=36166 RepID=T1GAY2_MEGSC